MRITAYYALLMVIAALVGGCQDNANQRVPVAGTVLIDGQPLTSGTIRFVPESGRPASSAIMNDGSFELAAESVSHVSEPGVPPGKYRLQVSASTIVDDETIHWNAPAKYADFRTSGLDVVIDKPTDNLVVELTWGDAKPLEDANASITPNETSRANAADQPSSATDARPATGEGPP